MADRIDPLVPEPIEPPLDRDLLDAWQPPEPPLDFADRLLEAEPVRRRPPIAAVRGFAAAAAILLGVWLGLGLDRAPAPPPDTAAPVIVLPEATPGVQLKVEAGEVEPAHRAKRRFEARRQPDGLPMDAFNGQVLLEADEAMAPPEGEPPEVDVGREAAVEVAY